MASQDVLTDLAVSGKVSQTGTPSAGTDLITKTFADANYLTSILDNAVTNAKLADVPTATFKGRTTAGTGDPEDLTTTQATALLNLFSTSATTKGLVPGSNGAGATFYLDATGAWSVPAGGGSSVPFTAASATGPATLDFAEDTDNGTNRVRITAPATLTADTTLTLPSVTGNVVAGLNGANGLWIGTVTEYNAIGTPSSTVAYIILDDP